MQNAAGNGTTSFGTAGDNWNSNHFLDLAEFTAAFAIGYDWLYNYWTDTRRTALMWSIITLGLDFGVGVSKRVSRSQTWKLISQLVGLRRWNLRMVENCEW
jgi:hypothetical protein